MTEHSVFDLTIREQIMDGVQRLFYRQTFVIRFLTYSGNEFQNLFSDLMQRAYKSNFQKVRPYGPKGDLKCDGYLSSQKTVFQCYAPRELKESKTVDKIDEDYLGAKTHWGANMRRWVFVHNDHDGLPAGVVMRLETLKRSEHPIKIGWWTRPELVDCLDKLSLADLEDFLGPQPTGMQFDRIGFSDIQPVLTAIVKSEPDPEPVIKAPSLKKIEHNQLSSDTATFLKLGRQRERAVQDFLERWPEPAFGDQIAETYRRRYIGLRDAGLSGEEIFADLLRFSGIGQGTTSAHNAAVLAVITYFFERCEIFEDPNGVVFSS